MTKLVGEKCNDWDEQLSGVLYIYCTTYKVMNYMLFQLIYYLHPLMPI
jgi:hypothetical protein